MVYNVSATMTFASSRMRVGITSGSTTNSASDGMVNTALAATVVSRRSAVVRQATTPQGNAIARPANTGTSDSLR